MKKQKQSLRNEKLIANRASETEERRKNRLRITRKHLATLKRLKRGDEMSLREKRRWSLENSSGWPWRWKKKTGEECSYRMAQVGHGETRRKKSKTGEDGSYHTAQVGPGDRGRKKRETGTLVR